MADSNKITSQRMRLRSDLFGLQERRVSNMAIISRAKMRGKALDYDCKKAKISTNESGPQDNRLFCYGLIDCSTESYLEKCINCGAFVDSAKPLGVE